MIPGFILLFLVAALDWVAVAKNWKKVEYIAKPAAMLVLLGLLALVGGFSSLPLICFGLGIFFSLAGDVFLMISYARFSERWFLPGLAAFLCRTYLLHRRPEYPFAECLPDLVAGIGRRPGAEPPRVSCGVSLTGCARKACRGWCARSACMGWSSP